MLVQWPGSVSSLLSVSLFKFITWDRSQLVGLGIPLRFIAKPSYSGHCTSTNVVFNSPLTSDRIWACQPELHMPALTGPCDRAKYSHDPHWHIALPLKSTRHQSKSKSQFLQPHFPDTYHDKVKT